MKKITIEVTNLLQFIKLLSAAKCGGQFVSIEYESNVTTNKYPKGTARKDMRPEIALQGVWTKRNRVEYHFKQDYEKTVAAALGIDSYEAHDGNREHLLPSIIMRYISTGNVCCIAMPTDVQKLGVFRDGNPATAADLEYLEPYKVTKPAGVVPYITIGVKNIRRMCIGGAEYLVNITDTYIPAAVPEYAAAVAEK